MVYLICDWICICIFRPQLLELNLLGGIRRVMRHGNFESTTAAGMTTCMLVSRCNDVILEKELLSVSKKSNFIIKS